MCNILTFFVMFWVDKILLLRFYRTPENINDEILKVFLKKCKYVFFIHGVVQVWILSNPTIMTSSTFETSDGEDGDMIALQKTWPNGNLVLAQRFGLPHVILFIIIMFVLNCMVAFEDLLVDLMNSIPFISNMLDAINSDDEVISDDFYEEITTKNLVYEYKRALRTK